MQQFLNTCYFIQFSLATRIASQKVFFCALLVALVILSIVLRGSHTFIPTHAQFADSDPWNG
jgi:hypothetical protein